MLYAGRARAATTRSCDRFRENRKNDGMRRPDKRLQPPCRQTRRAPPLRGSARSPGRLGKGSFIFLLFAPRRSTPRPSSPRRARPWPRAQGWVSGVPGDAARAEPTRPRSAWGNRLLHVWLAAPARPNSAATRTTTTSLAGLVRMHDPHASRERRSAVEGGAIEGRCSLPRISPRPNAESRTWPNVDCRARAVPVDADRRDDTERIPGPSRTLRSPAHGRRAAAASIQRITSNVQARLPRTATGLRLWQYAPSTLLRSAGGLTSASRLPLTASESARTVLNKHHAGPWLWLNHS